jgi:hypothetical protein
MIKDIEYSLKAKKFPKLITREVIDVEAENTKKEEEEKIVEMELEKG